MKNNDLQLHTYCLFLVALSTASLQNYSPHSTVVENKVFYPFVLWPLNLNEYSEQSQRQPLPLRRPVGKNKTTPLIETANYSVWPLLKYLMIFTSRQKCPGVIELPPWNFIGVTASISHKLQS